MTFNPSLLGLPLELRTRIFEHAGLVRTCLIDLSLERRRAHLGDKLATFDCGFYDYESDEHDLKNICGISYGDDYGGSICNHDPLPIAILSTNKQIRAEAMGLLFGRNKFFANCTEHEVVGILNSFPVDAWKYLSELHINFNGSSSDAITVWKEVCASLRRHLHPKTTRLYVASRYHGVTFSRAKEVLQALEGFPALRSLSVQLEPNTKHVPGCYGTYENGLCDIRSWIEYVRPLAASVVPTEGETPRPFVVEIPRQRTRTTWHTEPRRCCCMCCPPVDSICVCGTQLFVYSTSCTCSIILPPLVDDRRQERAPHPLPPQDDAYRQWQATQPEPSVEEQLSTYNNQPACSARRPRNAHWKRGH